MNDIVRVVFHPLNKVISIARGSTVLDAIHLAAIQFESICGGKGECGKCKVIFLHGSCTFNSPESTGKLSPDEITRNYCLACKTYITGNCEFIIPVESRIEAPKILLQTKCGEDPLIPSAEKYMTEGGYEAQTPSGHRSIRLRGYTGKRPQLSKPQHERLVSSEDPLTVTISRSHGYPEIIGIEEGDTTDRNFGIAIDLGTTTVVGLLVDLTTGKVRASASVLNRQITFGEELITRIAAVKDTGGKERLQKAAIDSINEVIDHMAAEIPESASAVNDVCVAGNTVMIYLMTGSDPSALELVNADVPRQPTVMRAQDLGLQVNPLTYIYCLPNVSRFVGGDAVGDVVISGMHRTSDLSLLVDLGTNGEVIFGNEEWLASASCASGPAFEGGGISSGIRAMRGAIEHVSIDPATTRVSWTTIGSERPKGVCGSGIIDAVAGMVRSGILDFTGKIVEGKPGVRPGDDGPEFVLVGKEYTATGREIVITRQDMAYLMDSKAAVLGAIGVLMKKYRISVGEVRHVYLAGAFGAYADLDNVVTFGILPRFFNAEYHPIGNGSLSGACAALRSQERRLEAESVAKKMAYIDLLVDSDFIEEYSAAIYIPGKKEYFPS
jgi:uncharacterized 2Fe-2S/4Fe-4S cluster protein (DUF4445 family)